MRELQVKGNLCSRRLLILYVKHQKCYFRTQIVEFYYYKLEAQAQAQRHKLQAQAQARLKNAAQAHAKRAFALH
jgi:hypothetical protein